MFDAVLVLELSKIRRVLLHPIALQFRSSLLLLKELWDLGNTSHPDVSVVTQLTIKYTPRTLFHDVNNGKFTSDFQ
jgi:hypothetical protein